MKKTLQDTAALVSSYLQKTKRYLLYAWVPFLYPRHCPFCREILPYGRFICVTCENKLPFTGHQTCLQCGKPVGSAHQALCYDCRTFPKSFQGGISLFLYNDMTKKAMNDLKYHNRRRNAQYFSRALYHYHARILNSYSIEAILPVPLHKNRLKKRGYNQAGLIADSLAEYLHIPVYHDLLIRKTDTPPQKELSAQARLRNLSKAFAVTTCPQKSAAIKSLHCVLLVDDIYTSGATMESCSRLLHSAGIEKVYIASVCIGLSRD